MSQCKCGSDDGNLVVQSGAGTMAKIKSLAEGLGHGGMVANPAK